MPVLLLAAAAWYYYRFDKNRQALELCNTCFGRLTKRDKILKIFLEHLAGYIHYDLQEYDKAIQHFGTALPVEEQLLGSKEYNLLYAQYALAQCYTYTEKFEEALQLLNKLLQNGFQSPQSSGTSNSLRNETP